MEHTYPTGVLCEICEIRGLQGEIVAEVKHDSQLPPTPIGPASVRFANLSLTAFYCERCKVAYHEVPGRPNAALEILQKIREQEDKEQQQRFERQREVRFKS